MTERHDAVIRVAKPEEFERVGDILVAAYNAIPGATADPDYDAVLREVADRASAVEVLVGESAERGIVATLTYVPGPGPYAELAQANEAEIRMLAVSPDAQGSGFGAVLLDHAITRATSDGRDAVLLSTSPWMRDAQRLYRSRGFLPVPSLDRVELSSGTEFELLAFRLALG